MMTPNKIRLPSRLEVADICFRGQGDQVAGDDREQHGESREINSDGPVEQVDLLHVSDR